MFQSIQFATEISVKELDNKNPRTKIRRRHEAIRKDITQIIDDNTSYLC